MRQEITLPSGARTIVRPLRPMDFVGATANIPEALALPKGKPKAGDDEAAARATEEQVQFGVTVARLSLTKACGPLVWPDGKKAKVVAKEFWECRQGEIAVEELDQQDAEAIVAAVAEATKAGKEAAEAAAPFPEKPAVAPSN